MNRPSVCSALRTYSASGIPQTTTGMPVLTIKTFSHCEALVITLARSMSNRAAVAGLPTEPLPMTEGLQSVHRGDLTVGCFDGVEDPRRAVVVEFIEYDQLDAATSQQRDRPVGEGLNGAATPGGVAQSQQQVGGDSFGPGVRLQGHFEDGLASRGLGFVGRVELLVVVNHGLLADPRCPGQGTTKSGSGLPPADRPSYNGRKVEFNGSPSHVYRR